MEQILKRLELIKTSISLEDQEIIDLQVTKLSTMEIDDDVHGIIAKLSDSDYSGTIAGIDSYIARFSGVVIYEDKEVGALRMELKVLEQKLQELSEEKNEYLNEINDFNVLYNLHLGEIIRKILSLKQDILHRKTMLKRQVVEEAKEQYDATQEEFDKIKESLREMKQELDDMDALDDAYDELLEEFQSLKEKYRQKTEELNDLQCEIDALEEEYENDPDVEDYEEARQDYEEFSDDYEEILQEERFNLNDDERQELKKAFRKASKLCHPDIVPDELKEQALKLMQELNEAYSIADLSRVLEILQMLENGGGFEVASDNINDKEVLRAKIDELRSKIGDITDEIDEIRNDDTFQTIQELDDWNDYFSGLKSLLSEEEASLQRQAESLASLEKDATPHDDDYWKSEF